MKQIKLTQGKVALVDDGDFKWLIRWKWYAKESSNSWYAVRNETKAESAARGAVYSCNGRRKIRMHNSIMKPVEGMEVHHKDRDGLNNRRDNLEICTHSENVGYQERNNNAREDNIPL